MAGAKRAAQFICQFRRLDVIALRLREQLGGVGGEYRVNADCFQTRAIGFQRARIARKILVRAELQRVDEDAHHHTGCVLACHFNQCEMAVVQIAHGGHEGDIGIVGAPAMQVI